MEILLNVLIFGGGFLRLLAAPSNLFFLPLPLPFVLILPKPLYPPPSLSPNVLPAHTHTHTHTHESILHYSLFSFQTLLHFWVFLILSKAAPEPTKR